MPLKINNTIIDKPLLHLVPHGINSNVFTRLSANDKRIKEKKKALFGDKQYKFVLFHNSRNVQRKKTSNTILAFRTFCDNLPPEEAAQCALVLHTEHVQDMGTDLPVVIEALCPKYKVIIDSDKMSPDDMCAMYNIATVTILISSNEGFGLSIAESIMCETPVIVNVTGGLQDQIGQTDDTGNPVVFDSIFGTNTTGKYKNHGVWAKPVWPTALTIQGSPQTPYIYDDICDWRDAADAIMYWYMMDPEDRAKCGAEGRRWACNEGGINSVNMNKQFMDAVDFTINNFVPSARAKLYTVDDYIGHEQPNASIGIEIGKINIEQIKQSIIETKNKLSKI